MAYPEAIQYLESFINYEKIPAYPYKESFKLERIKDFLTTVNNPQDSLKCIHVAGTKGKGSTCAFIAYILRQAGYKVGLYTSPHLSDFRERIRILTQHPTPKTKHQDVFEGMISKNKLTELVVKLQPAIDEYNKNSKYGPLSFFEVYTSLAFVYFKEKKADFVVLETGLGGRLDATNVVNPLVCAITPISYEHTQKLGNTLEEIAKEKAGIIKIQNSATKISGFKIQNLVVISAPQEKEVIRIIRKKCESAGARLYEVGKDIACQKNKDAFNVKGIFGEYTDLKTRLIGKHQFINATTAIGAIEALRNYNIKVGVGGMRGGLYNTVWPGRCEVISRRPLVVLDGAQNIASSRVLKETVRNNFRYKKLILVFGVSKDKDIKGICNELNDIADEVILTKANNPRATPPEILARYFNGRGVHITSKIKEAREISRRMANKEDLILVTGSLFVVGEFRDDKA